MNTTQKVCLVTMIVGLIGLYLSYTVNINPSKAVGDVVDSLHGVEVYYNGSIGHVDGRNTVDGYNVGLRYQCVEFVKRYYFEHYQHRFPDAYGHAISFYDAAVGDGDLNAKRGLVQFSNPSSHQPQVGDLVVFDTTIFNRYGHVAIVSDVSEDSLEIIQQNPGPFGDSRERYDLLNSHDKWRVDKSRILGWLRMP